jgi:hypothetical protein
MWWCRNMRILPLGINNSMSNNCQNFQQKTANEEPKPVWPVDKDRPIGGFKLAIYARQGKRLQINAEIQTNLKP